MDYPCLSVVILIVSLASVPVIEVQAKVTARVLNADSKGVLGVEHLPKNDQFDSSFNQFLSTSEHQGAAVGMMHHGKLVYTQGYGRTADDKKVTPETLFQPSSISKSLTAVAILKLAEEKKLSLTDKVFGKYGILNHLSPWSAHRPDKRLYDITVDDLLRHAAGWNSNKPPLFDPLLNDLYLSKGYRVPNIMNIMKLKKKAEPKDILKYVMSLPLHFQPGTQSVYSNLGYFVLSKIIEKVQDYDYQTFVRRVILEPCGMWHTKMDIHNLLEPNATHNKHNTVEFTKTDPAYMESVAASSILGWFTNVYDIMRFVRCLDHSGNHHLLTEHSVKLIMEKPSRIIGDVETWMGAGFNVNKNGFIWQENDMKTDDLLLFHKNILKSIHGRHNDTDQSADSMVMLLVGRKTNRLYANEFMNYVKDWSSSQPDYFNYDLADIRVGVSGKDEKIIKYHLSEHHISAYITAIKDQQYKLEWVSAFELKRQSFFTVIARINPGQKSNDYYFQHGLDEKRLLHYKNVYYKKHAYLNLLQSYISFSHVDRQKYMALFNKEEGKPVDIKYGIEQFSQPYKLFVHVYLEKGYVPRVQSFVHINQEPIVCFILEKKPIKDFKEYMDLNLKELVHNVKSNADNGRVMTYLDSSTRYRKPRFSAIFRKDDTKQGLFKYNLNENDLEEIILKEYKASHYYPKFLIGYANKKQILQFAIYFEKTIALDKKSE